MFSTFSSHFPFLFFFFNHTAPTDIYTLSLHDALPIWPRRAHAVELHERVSPPAGHVHPRLAAAVRSEEHTSELQSRLHLVCRLLLEKKKKKHNNKKKQIDKNLNTTIRSKRSTTHNTVQ